MAAIKLTIGEFVTLAKTTPVFDVRSPAEYNHAHFPGSHSLPLFTNEERAIVGTAYKQQSRETAIKLGLDFFGAKMRKMVEEVEAIINSKRQANNKSILVHCWRGGMRSAAVAWLLDMFGFKVYTLAGGIKRIAIGCFNNSKSNTSLLYLAVTQDQEKQSCWMNLSA